MSTPFYSNDAPTEPVSVELEYQRRGWQMVRELELFLRAGLADPHGERHIPFLAPFPAMPNDGSLGSAAPANPVKE
jgi:hypothetical protein